MFLEDISRCPTGTNEVARELRAGRMPHDENAVRVAAESGDVFVDPTEELGDVAIDITHFHLRE